MTLPRPGSEDALLIIVEVIRIESWIRKPVPQNGGKLRIIGQIAYLIRILALEYDMRVGG
jgi:hypothetical protein